ncbi:hypothetical protein [Methanimicrococcus hongohii]|uniref:hypothetical protein n=1 Tax=Methanimicrococcus hongohii TaxID=3028295 RepID=UPI002930C244|nr:hypothetical protein [Methanimicrococcus sp. Hf6]
MVITFLLSMVTTTATAAVVNSNDAAASFMTTEYDVVMKMKQTPVSLLEKAGYSAETIDTFTNFSFEEALLERAQLSENELFELGYNESQILLLQSYDGGSLEDNSQMNSLFAQVTGNLSGESYSKNRIEANFSWEWSHAPLLNGRIITDVVACSFIATNDENIACAVMVDDASCTIEYYRGDSKIGEDYPSFSSLNGYGIPEAKFPMSKSFGYTTGWAKKGTLTVAVKEVVPSDKLYSVYFAFGYGHTCLTLSPSIRTSGGGGLMFGLGTDDMFFKTISVRHDGTYDIYNGNNRSGQFMSSAQLFGIFGILSLIAMVAAPFLLVSLVTKIQNKKTPVWECWLLAAGAFCLWFWLLIVFGSLPGA